MGHFLVEVTGLPGSLLSGNQHTRLLVAVDSGSSSRAVAALFGVAPSRTVRWRAQQRETGDIAPKRRGGDSAACGLGPVRPSLCGAVYRIARKKRQARCS